MFRPATEWDRIAGERTSVDELLRRYILPLAAFAPIATFIGMESFDRAWDADQGYLVPSDQIFATAATTFFAIVASIFALAAIMVVIAPMYKRKPDFLSALKVSIHGASPLLLSGAVLVLPVMVVVSMVAFCYTLFLYHGGVTRVLQIREDQFEFIGISMVLLTFVSMMAGMIVASIGII